MIPASRANWIALLFGLAVFCGLSLGERAVIEHYYPSSDEMVLLANSAAPFHPDAAEWIRTGFSRYFMAYPDWYAPYFSFLRPVMNGFYYIESLLFGRNWGYYLLGNYLLIALMAALVVWIGLRQLSLTRNAALLAGLTILACPAFIPQAFFYPVFASDALASVLVIAAFITLRTGRYGWCAMALLLAVFAKESTLAVPAAAAGYILLAPVRGRPPRSFTRRCCLAAVLLLPAVLWVVVRTWVFGPGAQVYVAAPLSGMGATLTIVAKGLAHWPTGVVLRGSRLTLGLGAGINLLFWLAAGVGVWRGLTSKKITSAREDPAWHAAVQLWLFAAATGGLLVVVSAQNRLGACFYPWFVLLIFYCRQRGYLPTLRVAGALCVVTIACGGIWQKREVFGDDKARMVRRSEMSRKFVAAVAGSRADVIFLLDDVVSGADTADAVRRFSGSHARLIKVSNLDLNTGEPAVLLERQTRYCAGTPAIAVARESDSKFTVTSSLHEDGLYHSFDDAALDLVCARSAGSNVSRTEGAYAFEYAREDLLRSSARILNPDVVGDATPMTVEVTGPLAKAEILVPDLCRQSFRTISLAPGSRSALMTELREGVR